MTLVKSGYYNGNPDYVYASNVETVMNTFHYELYMREFETTFQEMNTTKINPDKFRKGR